MVTTSLGFGLRHGIDWDHIAAITDLTGSQRSSRRRMWIATLYALGHALVVFVLGSIFIVAGESLPPAVDDVMERIVGVTLVVLGGYVFYALARDRRDFRMRSRWTLVFRAGRRLRQQVVEIVHSHDHDHSPERGHGHEHDPEDIAVVAAAAPVKTRHSHLHHHRAVMPNDPFTGAGSWTALSVGMLHGIGAETATQVLVFMSAANASGTADGLVVLAAFITGLLISNTGLTLAATTGLIQAERSFPIYVTIAVITGLGSLSLGVLYLLGNGSVLPPIFAG